MSNETKRDVFDEMKWELIRNLANTIDQNGGLRPVEDATKVGENYTTRYTAAIPDNLPVIPKAVGEYIKWGKSYDIQLYMMYSFKFIHSQGFKKLTDNVESWIISNSDTFARAWLLGVWRVEETGEIVKLEAYK